MMKQFSIELVHEGEEETSGSQNIGQVIDLIHQLKEGDALVINRIEDKESRLI